MGNIKEPAQAIPITGLLYRADFAVDEVLNLLADEIGSIALYTSPQPFAHTTYYREEMGDRLMRQWYAFDTLIDPGELSAMKHTSNEIEQKYTNEHGRRSINIDPGVISLGNLILASTKNYSHRIYLGKGIYAELTLLYRDKQFQPLAWTYPDYRESRTLDFFGEVRALLKKKLAAQHGR